MPRSRQNLRQQLRGNEVLEIELQFIADETTDELHRSLDVKCRVIGAGVGVLVLDVVTFFMQQLKVGTLWNRTLEILVENLVSTIDADWSPSTIGTMKALPRGDPLTESPLISFPDRRGGSASQ